MSPRVRLSTGEIEQAVRQAIHRVLIESAGWRTNRNAEAFRAFDALVEMRCDPLFLASRLVILKEAHCADTWKGLTGFANPDTLRTALNRLRVCADDIDRFLSGMIGKNLLLQNPSDSALSASLRNLSDQLARTVRVIKPSTNLTKRGARGGIVRHVENRTGGPHDRLVAAILYPALRCDERTQSQWRHDNPQVLISVRGT
jgi:hypothetical protein